MIKLLESHTSQYLLRESDINDLLIFIERRVADSRRAQQSRGLGGAEWIALESYTTYCT